MVQKFNHICGEAANFFVKKESLTNNEIFDCLDIWPFQFDHKYQLLILYLYFTQESGQSAH